MNSQTPALPGLERLLEVCRKNALPIESLPPGRAIPLAGTLVAGHPFDPVLAAVYQRFGRARFGGEDEGLLLHQFDDQMDGLTLGSEQRRRGTQEPFYSSVIFGSVPAFPNYYATVPKLADSQGRQPVIFIDATEEVQVLPIASDVDLFFELLSRYFERMVRDESFQLEGFSDLLFPQDVPDLAARDRALVERLVAGDFDFLLTRTEGTRKWLSRVRKAAGP